MRRLGLRHRFQHCGVALLAGGTLTCGQAVGAFGRQRGPRGVGARQKVAAAAGDRRCRFVVKRLPQVVRNRLPRLPQELHDFVRAQGLQSARAFTFVVSSEFIVPHMLWKHRVRPSRGKSEQIGKPTHLVITPDSEKWLQKLLTMQVPRGRASFFVFLHRRPHRKEVKWLGSASTRRCLRTGPSRASGPASGRRRLR